MLGAFPNRSSSPSSPASSSREYASHSGSAKKTAGNAVGQSELGSESTISSTATTFSTSTRRSVFEDPLHVNPSELVTERYASGALRRTGRVALRSVVQDPCAGSVWTQEGLEMELRQRDVDRRRGRLVWQRRPVTLSRQQREEKK
jgi:hypothetical protein